MNYSILIPTINRYQDLLRTVISLKNIKPDVSVYICDQSASPSGDIVDTIKKFKNIYYFHVSFRSLTKARNFLVSVAKEEICIFIDDDVEICSNYFDRISHYFSLPEVTGLTGPSPRPDQKIITKDEITGDFNKDIKQGILYNNVNFYHNPLWMGGCNHAFRRKDIIEVGGYDEVFFGPIGEDVEMSIRMIRKIGGKLVYEPTMSLIHYQSPSGGCRNEVNVVYKNAVKFADSLYHTYRTYPFYIPRYLHSLRVFLINKNLFKKPISTFLVFLLASFFCIRMICLNLTGYSKSKILINNI